MKKYLLTLCVLFLSTSSWAKNYAVPPSSMTRGNVPVISDEQMEYCVILYNDMLDLEKNIQYINNQYEYNLMVNKFNQMTNYFNQNCAGKQSRSAAEAAKKLSQQ